jgi:hypothetical protein
MRRLPLPRTALRRPVPCFAEAWSGFPTRSHEDGFAAGAEDNPVGWVNVALIAEAVDALAKLQERTGLKKVDLVNRALLVYEFVDAELKAGKQVLVPDQDGRDQLVKIFL